MTEKSTQQNHEENSTPHISGTFTTVKQQRSKDPAVGGPRHPHDTYQPSHYPRADQRFGPPLNAQNRPDYRPYEKARPTEGWKIDDRVSDLRQGEPESDMDYAKATDWNQPDAAEEYHRYWDQRPEHIEKFGQQSYI